MYDVHTIGDMAGLEDTLNDSQADFFRHSHSVGAYSAEIDEMPRPWGMRNRVAGSLPGHHMGAVEMMGMGDLGDPTFIGEDDQLPGIGMSSGPAAGFSVDPMTANVPVLSNLSGAVTGNGLFGQQQQTAIVNTQSTDLNCRSGPGTGFPLVGSLKKGSTVTITGAEKNGFLPVAQGSLNGWASSAFLTVTSLPPPIPAPAQPKPPLLPPSPVPSPSEPGKPDLPLNVLPPSSSKPIPKQVLAAGLIGAGILAYVFTKGMGKGKRGGAFNSKAK